MFVTQLRYIYSEPASTSTRSGLWLRHVLIDTTNIYAEVDLEMKAKALAHCESHKRPNQNMAQQPNADGVLEGALRPRRCLVMCSIRCPTPHRSLAILGYAT